MQEGRGTSVPTPTAWQCLWRGRCGSQRLRGNLRDTQVTPKSLQEHPADKALAGEASTAVNSTNACPGDAGSAGPMVTHLPLLLTTPPRHTDCDKTQPQRGIKPKATENCNKGKEDRVHTLTTATQLFLRSAEVLFERQDVTPAVQHTEPPSVLGPARSKVQRSRF